MKFGDLLVKERELVFRSLAFCGVHIRVDISDWQGRFKISENELAENDVREIHLQDATYEGITGRLEELGFKFKGIIKGWKIFAPSKNVLHLPGFSGSFQKSDIVQLNLAFLNSPAGTLAFVTAVDEYQRAELLSKNGDVFSLSERDQIDHLIFIKSNSSIKEFESHEIHS